MSRAIVVLGMHRSGTSCAMKLLQGCGVFLGDDLLAPGYCNLSGLQELRAIVEINDRLLAQVGASWDRPPVEPILADAELAQRMHGVISDLAKHPIYGWKDPRTLLTFSEWEKVAPNLEIVACLRHPAHVAASLARRDNLSFDAGISLWKAYNTRLLTISERYPRMVWFDFDQPVRYYAAWLERACRLLDLPYQTGAAATFIDQQRHDFRDSMTPIDPEALIIYQQLRERMEKSPSAVAIGPLPLESTPSALERRVEELAILFDRQIEIAQLHWQQVQTRFGETIAHQLQVADQAVAARRATLELENRSAEWLSRLDQTSHATQQIEITIDDERKRIARLIDELKLTMEANQQAIEQSTKKLSASQAELLCMAQGGFATAGESLLQVRELTEAKSRLEREVIRLNQQMDRAMIAVRIIERCSALPPVRVLMAILRSVRRSYQWLRAACSPRTESRLVAG